MKSKSLLFLLSISIVFSSVAQKTSKETWNRILQKADVEWNLIYEKCPNFPKENLGEQEFSKDIFEWNKNYPEEVTLFYSIENIKKINPSPYYLGLPLNENENQYDNSFIQWLKESKISDRRIMELAPHFPDMNIEKEQFLFQFERWKSLYGHEYENIINSKELVALNPYYKEYIDVSQIPHFIGPLESKDKPMKLDSFKQEELLTYELKLMNWYFVFEQENFKKIYGFSPEFPACFDVENYKLALITKIEETEKQRKLGNFETN